MKVEELEVPKEKVEQELESFKEMVKSERKAVLQQTHRDLQRIYGHIKHGGSIIDIFSSFSKAGLNEEKDPKLAVCRADAKICYCYKDSSGSALYSVERDISFQRKTAGDILLPKGTFTFGFMDYSKRFIQAPVPMVPTSILAPIKHTLRNYDIIWEVQEWKPVPPKDPILTKIIGNSIALVLATWDLTELERTVIRGRL